jgi:hypothetical protein
MWSQYLKQFLTYSPGFELAARYWQIRFLRMQKNRQFCWWRYNIVIAQSYTVYVHVLSINIPVCQWAITFLFASYVRLNNKRSSFSSFFTAFSPCKYKCLHIFVSLILFFVNDIYQLALLLTWTILILLWVFFRYLLSYTITFLRNLLYVSCLYQ